MSPRHFAADSLNAMDNSSRRAVDDRRDPCTGRSSMTSRALRRQLVVVALVSTMLVGCTKYSSPPPAAPPSGREQGPRTLTEARQFLVGNWTLVSMDVFPPTGPPIKNAATGTMVYDEYSNMNVKMVFSEEASRVAEKIGIPIVDRTLITNGRTLIDIGARTLTYVLEGERDYRPVRHPLDTNLPRYWQADGNNLILRTKDPAGKDLTVSVWRRGA